MALSWVNPSVMPIPRLRRPTFLLIVLAIVLAGCRPWAAPTPAVGGEQQLLVLPDDGAQPVLDLIRNAQHSIRFKIYVLSHAEAVAALAQAANRGVDVRVLIEQNPVGGGENNLRSAETLQAAGVAVKWAPTAFALTHEKSLVVDDQQALIATFNFTQSSFNGNREYGLLSSEPAVVAEVAAIFDADWAGKKPKGRDNSPLVVSPVNSRRHILALIDEAKQSLWLEQATLLDDEVTKHLVAAARRGVEVRFISALRTNEEDLALPNLESVASGGRPGHTPRFSPRPRQGHSGR